MFYLKKCSEKREKKRIRGCVSTVAFSIDGRPKDKFKGEKGLRQGDLLSPFLFN